MTRPKTALAPALTTAALLAVALPAAAHETQAWRLIVADAEEGAVAVHDLGEGEALSVSLPAPARLHAGQDGTRVWMVQRDPGTVALLDTGLEIEDHGDHMAAAFGAPALLPGTFSGERPAHVNMLGDTVAVFFDDTGEAAIVSARAMAAGEAAPRLVATNAPHHGIAAPVPGGGLILSVPTEGESLPDALRLVDAGGAEVATVACPGMHGEGRAAGLVAFGCTDGIAVFDPEAGTARHIPAPEGLPEGAVRTMLSPRDTAGLVGSWGSEGFVILDPQSEDGHFAHVSLPAPRMAWALDEAGFTGFAILSDGRLVRFDALTGEITAETEGVTGPYSMERGVVRPMVAVAGGRVGVSDPAAGVVALLNAGDLSGIDRLPVGGTPQGVVLLSAETAHDH